MLFRPIPFGLRCSTDVSKKPSNCDEAAAVNFLILAVIVKHVDNIYNSAYKNICWLIKFPAKRLPR